MFLCDPPGMTRHGHNSAQAPERKYSPHAQSGKASASAGGGFARGFAHLGVLQVSNRITLPSLTSREAAWAAFSRCLRQRRAPCPHHETCRTLRFRDIARWRVSRSAGSNQRLLRIYRTRFRFAPDRGSPDSSCSGGTADLRRTRGFHPKAILWTPSARVAPSRACSNRSKSAHVLADAGSSPGSNARRSDLGAAPVIVLRGHAWTGYAAPNKHFQVVSRAVSAAAKAPA